MADIELELYTPENCTTKKTSSSISRILIYSSGRIVFNQAACEKAHIKMGTKVSIGKRKDAETEDEAEFYLVNVGPTGIGFEVKNEKGAGKGLYIQNSPLCRIIRDAVGPELKGSLHFQLGASVATKAGKSPMQAFCLLYKPKI